MFLYRVTCKEPIRVRRYHSKKRRNIILPKINSIEQLKQPKDNYVPLEAGDVVAYHGNLSYYLNYQKEGTKFLFLHLVEGRGVKWEKDNM